MPLAAYNMKRLCCSQEAAKIIKLRIVFFSYCCYLISESAFTEKQIKELLALINLKSIAFSGLLFTCTVVVSKYSA